MLLLKAVSIDVLCSADPLAFFGTVPLPGEIELYLVPLHCDDSFVKRVKGFLSPEELARCDRLIDPERSRRAVLSRGLLRVVLARYLKIEPGAVPLVAGDFGKPQLAPSLPHPISFNLSHSGDFIVFAATAGARIGVDIERVQDELAFGPMAARYFSPREQEELFSLPESDRLPAFYRCWTRKEAYLKATGSGFSQPANSFDVPLLPQHSPALLSHRIYPEEPNRWTIKDVVVPEGYLAALALET